MKTENEQYEIWTRGRYDDLDRRSSWAFVIGKGKKEICLIECGNKDYGFEEEKANAELICAALNAYQPSSLSPQKKEEGRA